MNLSLSMLESPPIHGWEVDPDFVTYWNGQEYIACYRFEEADEFNGEAFGAGSTRDLAIADLALNFPREA
jgi:hypothetical protein